MGQFKPPIKKKRKLRKKSEKVNNPQSKVTWNAPTESTNDSKSDSGSFRVTQDEFSLRSVPHHASNRSILSQDSFQKSSETKAKEAIQEQLEKFIEFEDENDHDEFKQEWDEDWKAVNEENVEEAVNEEKPKKPKSTTIPLFQRKMTSFFDSNHGVVSFSDIGKSFQPSGNVKNDMNQLMSVYLSMFRRMDEFKRDSLEEIYDFAVRIKGKKITKEEWALLWQTRNNRDEYLRLKLESTFFNSSEPLVNERKVEENAPATAT